MSYKISSCTERYDLIRSILLIESSDLDLHMLFAHLLKIQTLQKMHAPHVYIGLSFISAITISLGRLLGRKIWNWILQLIFEKLKSMHILIVHSNLHLLFSRSTEFFSTTQQKEFMNGSI